MMVNQSSLQHVINKVSYRKIAVTCHISAAAGVGNRLRHHRLQGIEQQTNGLTQWRSIGI